MVIFWIFIELIGLDLFNLTRQRFNGTSLLKYMQTVTQKHLIGFDFPWKVLARIFSIDLILETLQQLRHKQVEKYVQFIFPLCVMIHQMP